MGINNSNGVMKIWEEAFFCLSQDPVVVQEYFKWKRENKNFDPPREKKEYEERVSQMSTKLVSQNLNELIRESRWEYRSALKEFDWFSDPNQSRIQFKIEILKEEIRSRPTEKRNRKEIRQERAKQNRSHGKCKNR